MLPSLTNLLQAMSAPFDGGKSDRIMHSAQALMDMWCRAHWLPHPLTLIRSEVTDRAFAQVVPHASPSNITPYQVHIALDHRGQFPSFLKPSHSRLRSLTIEPGHYLALVLGHEAGHTVFQKIWAPFSPGRYQPLFERHPGLVDDVNHYVLGAAVTNPFDLGLEEGFADVYGTMLMLHSANFSVVAMDAVRDWARMRAANHQWFLAEGHSMAPVLPWADAEAVFLYDTAPALNAILDRVGEWAHTSPDKWCGIALAVISDVWLERAAHHVQERDFSSLMLTGHNRFANRIAVAASENDMAGFMKQAKEVLGNHPVFRQWSAVLKQPGLITEVTNLCTRHASFDQFKLALNHHYSQPASGEPDEEEWSVFLERVSSTCKSLEMHVLKPMLDTGPILPIRRSSPRP